MIIGTAGHIDHGKTTLVRALTGVDTDRLKEEKTRGISIELGYAYTPLANGDILGFIDVPGHERLIHTMAAGASGIDFGLLVVAADDGVMPQTREHLAILSLLGVRQGAIAITKRDRADSNRLHDVNAQVQQLVANTFLQDQPVFTVAATVPDDPGVAALQAHLHTTAQATAARSATGLFRLAIDRVFTLRGHGTIVTGTVHDGILPLHDTSIDLQLMPSARPVRVRSIHAQNQPASEARAGQRCALNIVGIDDTRDIERGHWIADARCFTPSHHVDVQLNLLADAASEIRAWTPLHIHLGAAHHVAHAVPLSTNTLNAGQSGMVQLVFEQPVCTMPGDRYIARDAQAKHTIAGGIVLDANAPQRKRRTPARLAWLQSVATLEANADLSGVLQQAPQGLDEHQLMRLLRRNPNEVAIPGNATWVRPKGAQTPAILILQPYWNDLADHVLHTLAAFHERWPDEPGIESARLRRMAAPTLPDDLWLAMRDRLIDEQRVTRNGPWLHLPRHSVSLTAQQQLLAEQLLPLLRAGNVNPPWVRDLARQLHATEDDVRVTLLKLLRQGEVFQVVRDLFYHNQSVQDLATALKEAASQNGITAAGFRDTLGLGRKRTIQILEFFNRIGYTRRIRDKHVVRKTDMSFVQRLS